MFGLSLRIFVFISLALMLAACAIRPKPLAEVQQVYDIRAVAITANDGIARTLLRGIKQRLDQAIEDTVRPAPLPRAVMNINVVNVARIPGYDGVRTETEISVTLTDVLSGQPLLVRNFLVYSFSISNRDADEAAAEAIASRLRVEYALTQPAIRRVPTPTPRLSTRMTDDTVIPLSAQENKPVVIPLKTAPVVGVDQDPVLNSKTKVAPDKQDAAVPVEKTAIDSQPKIADPQPAGNAVEDGARAKVVIKPVATQPTADEPCVETMDKKC